jgi:hypothetical protein
MNDNKIEIIPVYRLTGITNWILESCLHNQNVIVVCKHREIALDLERSFSEMAIKKTISISGKTLFVTMKKYQPMKIDRPTVFDNSCFMGEGSLIRSEEGMSPYMKRRLKYKVTEPSTH